MGVSVCRLRQPCLCADPRCWRGGVLQEAVRELQERAEQRLRARRRRVASCRRMLWRLDESRSDNFQEWLRVGAAMYMVAPCPPLGYALLCAVLQERDTVCAVVQGASGAATCLFLTCRRFACACASQPGVIPPQSEYADVAASSLFPDWIEWTFRVSDRWARISEQAGYDDSDLYAVGADARL